MKNYYLFQKRKRNHRGLHFKKRKSRWDKWREYIWPSMGLVPFLRYTELKVKRQKDAQHAVALGFSIGIFGGLMPILGQVVLALGLAWVLRANMVMAALATFISNPWTYALIMAWNYKFGHWLVGNHAPPPMPEMGDMLTVMFEVTGLFQDIYLPMLLGGVITGGIAALFAYIVVRVNIARYHAARHSFLHRRRASRLARRHGQGAGAKLSSRLPSR